jgi:RNA polymerase sigma-70 factor (ECF subfamily)
MLYAYALPRINDDELARDLVQETFLAALERKDKFEGRSSESTWLTAILKNKIIDVYRKNSSGLRGVPPGLRKNSSGSWSGTEVADAEREQQEFFDPKDGHWTVAHQPQALGIEAQDPLMHKELSGMLKKCLDKLPALWLSVFTMKHMDDQPSEVICRELKVTPSNFWVIIHRAKLNLRACIQKSWF